MAQAPTYTRAVDFSNEEAANVGGRSTVRTAAVDSELDSIGVSINALVANVSKNQRDDGEIRDGRVKLFTLNQDVLALLATYGATPRGPWLTATSYGIKDLVSQGGNTYIGVSAHTSGVFATDLAAGKWVLFSLSASPSATQVVFTPTANIAAANVQAAIEESDTENRALSSTAQTTANTAQSSATAAATLAANNDIALRADLINIASAAKGPALMGHNGALNYAAQTVGARLIDVGASPRSFGATGDGVIDDTAFIVSALLYSKTLDLSNRIWKITSTIDLPAGCVINMRGGAIVAATGVTAPFQFIGAKEGLYIQGGGSSSLSGQVTGTASAFVFIEGSTDTPTVPGHYARNIRIYDVHITSTTIGKFLDFNKAVRQVYIRGCLAFTQNGINASGKCVEVMISDSIIYGSIGGALTQNVGLTLSASTVGTGRTATAASASFTASDVGRKLAAGAGVAEITGYTSSTVVTITITVAFAGTSITSGNWSLGTYGIRLRSTGGTIYYNEGWSITNSTLDNFEITNDVTDCFVYTVTGGYTASTSTGYAFQFQAPSTTLCEELTIGGGAVIGGRIRFVASAAGQAYHANIDAVFNGIPGTAVALENNASNVTVRGKFKAGSATAIGVVGTNNNANIIASGDFDSTYQNGIVLNGATGANCVIGPVSGPTVGGLVGAARSSILYRGVAMQTAAVAGLNRTFSATNLGGGAAYTVGSTISSIAVGFSMGETGDLVVHLPYSGANAATQNLQFTVPSGMVLASGTGWSAANIYPGAAGGLVSVRIPYYCTADGSGNVVLANQAGNTLTVINQGYCGIVRNW